MPLAISPLILLLGLCLWLGVSLRAALAQTPDDCLSAPASTALALCQQLVDNGVRDAGVYWKLSSAQYQAGEARAANRTLDTAMQLYPGDTRLASLKQIITVDRNEQAMIAESARLNQQSLDRGALKIACLTRTGEIGISACRRRLELTGEDSERIQDRLRELLETQLASQQAVTPLTQTPSEAPPTAGPSLSTPEPEPFAETEPTEEEREAARAQALVQARRDAYKALVAEVQTRLNDFGFEAGYPDGVPGRNTRRALSAFYDSIGVPTGGSITDLTLEDLENEQRKRQLAARYIRESRTALAQGDRERASARLEQARQTSRLAEIPADLEQALQIGVVRDETTEQAPDTNVPSDALASIDPESPPTAPDDTADVPDLTGSDTSATARVDNAAGAQSPGSGEAPGEAPPTELNQLLSQINELQGRIRRQQADQARQLQAIREAM